VRCEFDQTTSLIPDCITQLPDTMEKSHLAHENCSQQRRILDDQPLLIQKLQLLLATSRNVTQNWRNLWNTDRQLGREGRSLLGNGNTGLVKLTLHSTGSNGQSFGFLNSQDPSQTEGGFNDGRKGMHGMEPSFTPRGRHHAPELRNVIIVVTPTGGKATGGSFCQRFSW